MQASSKTTKEGLTALGLTHKFGKRVVVKSLNLSLQRGEAVGLLGPNGAGKTTTFSIISGLLRPTGGHVYLDHQDITAYPIHLRARMGIGYLPQESSIFRGLSVSENILCILEYHEKDVTQRKQKLEKLLSEFSVTHLRNANAMTLSGGERRRVEIARALAASPKFIMLDEPLAGIDPIAVSEVRGLISHLKDRGIGVLITDHNVRETLAIVDRGYIIAEGRVIKEGTPQEIIQDEQVRKVYLGSSFHAENTAT